MFDAKCGGYITDARGKIEQALSKIQKLREKIDNDLNTVTIPEIQAGLQYGDFTNKYYNPHIIKIYEAAKLLSTIMENKK